MKLSSLFKLSIFDWYIFLRLFISMWLIRILLIFCKFKTLKDKLNKPVASRQKRTVSELITAIRIAEKRFLKDNCLIVGFAVKRLLAAYGHDTTLHMGIAGDEIKNFRGHAWLEYQGSVIAGYYEGMEELKEFKLG